MNPRILRFRLQAFRTTPVILLDPKKRPNSFRRVTLGFASERSVSSAPLATRRLVMLHDPHQGENVAANATTVAEDLCRRIGNVHRELAVTCWFTAIDGALNPYFASRWTLRPCLLIERGDLGRLRFCDPTVDDLGSDE